MPEMLLEMEAGTTYRVRVRAVDAAAVETVSPVAHLKLNVRTSASESVGAKTMSSRPSR